MIQNKRQLVDAIKAAGLPQNLLKIWDGDVPAQLRYTLQDPSSFFEAFLMHPEGIPSPDELVILWQTNGESIVGYLSVTGIFIRNASKMAPTITMCSVPRISKCWATCSRNSSCAKYQIRNWPSVLISWTFDIYLNCRDLWLTIPTGKPTQSRSLPD